MKSNGIICKHNAAIQDIGFTFFPLNKVLNCISHKDTSNNFL